MWQSMNNLHWSTHLSWTQPLFGGAVCAQAGETPDSNESLLSGVSETAESLSWTQPAQERLPTKGVARWTPGRLESDSIPPGVHRATPLVSLAFCEAF